MSVLATKRGEQPTNLTVLNDVLQLHNYIIQLLTNQKFFPKRYRWIIAYRIQKNINEIQQNVTSANTIKVTNQQSFKKRNNYQSDAYNLLCVQQTYLLQCGRGKFCSLPQGSFKTWQLKIYNLKNKLTKWMDSDINRYCQQGKN